MAYSSLSPIFHIYHVALRAEVFEHALLNQDGNRMFHICPAQAQFSQEQSPNRKGGDAIAAFSSEELKHRSGNRCKPGDCPVANSWKKLYPCLHIYGVATWEQFNQ